MFIWLLFVSYSWSNISTKHSRESGVSLKYTHNVALVQARGVYIEGLGDFNERRRLDYHPLFGKGARNWEKCRQDTRMRRKSSFWKTQT